MINKTYKRIHNKYSTFFKFIFFLRYLFVIFLIFIALFLIIPNFFDYKKKDGIIKNYLLKSYDLELNNYDNIKFHSLPTPNLEFQNASINFKSTNVNLKTQSLVIYPELVKIYNYENFEAKKIIFNNSKISIKENELKVLSNYIYKLKNKLVFNDLDLKISRENLSIIKLKKINYSNFGYRSNIITGEAFNRKFKTILKNNFTKINFKLLNAGISINLLLDKTKKITPLKGVVKAKILNSNIKFNFDYEKNQLMIYNSYFRSKDLLFNNESTIIYHPFFEMISKFNIEDINTRLFNYLDIEKILSSKDLIKQINSKNTINYKSKKYSRSLFDDLNVDFTMAYGRLVYSNNFLISNNLFNCEGDINLLEEYPILIFDCEVKLNDKKKLLKKFSIKYKTKHEPFTFSIKGNLNILNNKINIKNIQAENNYKASREDLNYFKDTFETILFDQDFLNIFRLEKIKQFILEVS